MLSHRRSSGATLLLVSVLGGWVGGCRRAEGEGQRARLVAETGSARLVEGRLSGFSYRPLGPLVKISARQASRLTDSPEASSSPAALADRGVLFLADAEHRSAAVSLLEQAQEKAPRDPRIASDLAAACLARGSVRDLFLALEAARTAVDLSPELPEARFNLALALEKLFLSDESVRAWNAFLVLEDSRSGWAEEARSHLRRLERASRDRGWQEARQTLEKGAEKGTEFTRRVVSAWRLRSRLFGEQVLLPRWAEAELGGDLQKAQATLATLRQIGESLSVLAGDAMLRDSVAAIDRAAARPDRLAELAQAHHDYGLAAQSYAQFDRRAAAAGFAVAEEELAKAGSPFHLWAALFIAACDYQRSRYEDAIARLDAVEGMAAGRYPNLQGRAEWIRSLIQMVLERPLAARESARAALAAFAKTGERGHQAAAHALLIEAESYLGEEKEVWSQVSQALSKADDLDDPRTRQMVAVIVTQVAIEEDKPRVGLYFQNEGVRWALAGGNPVQIAYALWDRTSLDLLSGRLDDARRDVAAASHWAARAGDEALSADILLLEARALALEDVEAALAKLDAALPLLRKTQYVRSLSSAYLLQGRLHVRSGRRDLAAAAFQLGIDQVERALGVLDDSSRLLFLDRTSELFDERIKLSAQMETEPWPTAFSYAERGRGRALAKLMADHRSRRRFVPRLAEVERTLPAGLALVEYSVLPDRLLSWVVMDGRTHSFSQPTGEAAIQSKVGRLTATITAGGMADRAAEDLYRILISPLALPRNKGLVIVPDKSLQEIPWSALRDPATDRALIEDHTLEIAPSAEFYLQPVPRRRRMAGSSAPILIVADPDLDRSLAGDLPRLPQAVAEAVELARLYGGADILRGEGATRKRVLAALGTHRVVHFGVHARIDGRSPLFSRLLLAPEPGEPGVLFARDLYGLKLPATELVVLAACESASGQVAGSEGVSSLARPFLAAGVPSVIGSLWRVDDTIAARVSTELHRSLRAGLSPAAALQKAQLTMLRSRDASERRLQSWAGLTLYSRAETSPRRAAR